MWTYQGLRVREGRIFTDNTGKKYPPQWWSATTDEEKKTKGLVWVDPAPTYDSRFYTGDGTPKALEDSTQEVDGETVIIPGLKSKAIAQTKITAGALLAPTDWMVIKASEVADYSVPADVTTYRAAVRTASNGIEAAITACTTHDAFMALYTTPVDENGDPTGPAPINAWPEAI
mgnify:CR=1 FL=1